MGPDYAAPGRGTGLPHGEGTIRQGTIRDSSHNRARQLSFVAQPCETAPDVPTSQRSTTGRPALRREWGVQVGG